MQFTLRPWNINDLECLVKYANNINIAKNLTNKFPYPYTEEAGRKFIDFATQDKIVHIFAIDVEGKAVGGIGIHPQDDIFYKNAELGYWIAEPFWGKGIISAAISQIIPIGFKIFPEVERIFARPYGSNIGSQKVLMKNGFELEAKLEKTIFKFDLYQDELIYSVRKEKWLKSNFIT